ncbi:hypothetical protein GQ457_04G012470 [Hibiscus cannabinus]
MGQLEGSRVMHVLVRYVKPCYFDILDGVFHHKKRPRKYWKWFKHINDVCILLSCVCFHNVFRGVTSLVDAIAKGRVDHAVWFQGTQKGWTEGLEGMVVP